MTEAARRTAELSKAIDARLARLTVAAEHQFYLSAERPDWGDVGLLADIERGLRELSDRVFGEGEYRPENVIGRRAC